MAQAITDVKTFLEDARQAVVELAEFEKQEETLAQEEKKRLRVLETERKAVADAVNSTVKKRRDEIEKSYDDELGKLQAFLSARERFDDGNSCHCLLLRRCGCYTEDGCSCTCDGEMG